MAFEYPSTITDRKEKEKKAKKAKKEKEEKDLIKTTKPIFDKKEGMSKELAIVQLEDAMGDKNLSTKSLKKVVDAAADEKQLKRTRRKLQRDIFKVGGRAGFKAGSKGCKLAMKGRGRAYGKNS
jgi:hypothetical protein